MASSFVTWMPPIVVALITGVFSYLGVIYASKSSHEKTMLELQSEQEKMSVIIDQQISSIKADIKRLEDKQDKHNAVIERTFKLEQKVDDLEKLNKLN